ncbi:MAG: hypothetical protein ABH842_04055 [Candidatus Micrarchaeota archaeon]
MGYQKIVIMVVAVLAIIAIYFTVAMQQPLIPEDTTAAEELLLKGMRFGLGENDYVFSYTEIADGYKTEYLLEKNYDNRSIVVQNPLSIKRAFFFTNETIMCIKYPLTANESCAYVNEDLDLQNYVESLSSKFFNDLIIEKNKNDITYLIENNYLNLDASMETTTINGNECEEISYEIDFSSISLNDAARFGISSNSPKKFNWRMCIDNQTGMVYNKYFNYSLNGRIHTYEIQATFKDSGANITKPSTLVESITSILYNERGQYTNLVKCYIEKEGNDRDKCIMDLALVLKRKDLCDSAGQRRDLCLISLVLTTKDTTICTLISDSGYKDNCYIELAGVYKNQSYCSMIINSSKLEDCDTAAGVTIQQEQNICDTMTDVNSKDSCNMMQATYHKNTTYCSYIQNQTMAFECINYNYTNATGMDPEYIFGLVNSTIDFVKYIIELQNGTANGTIPLPPIPN